jgi:hypothetical protein
MNKQTFTATDKSRHNPSDFDKDYGVFELETRSTVQTVSSETIYYVFDN